MGEALNTGALEWKSQQQMTSLQLDPAYHSAIPHQTPPPDLEGHPITQGVTVPVLPTIYHGTAVASQPPPPAGNARSVSTTATRDGPVVNGYSSDTSIPGSPTGTFSTFSMTSTLESRVFREDGGRRFQAQNDEYSLPNDEQELQRLEYQHRAIKAGQKGINYLGPMPGNLGEGMRALDVGCGTGIWAIEMAQEFPHVEWVATDLTPIQRDSDLPDNLHFVQNDITQGLPFPDASFDLVHARLLVMGIRNWKFIIEEVLRVLKPGGMLYHVECDFPWGLIGVPEDEWRDRAPGHCKFQDYLKMAVETRGYEPELSKVLPRLMRNSGQVRDVSQIKTYLPLWGWSHEPHMHQSGVIVRPDAEDIPNSVQIVIMDTCEIPAIRYEQLKRGYLDELGKPDATTAVPFSHTFGWKI
ncbi:hypothetical protein I317_00906 [Kwoniella heveanensis CBS 569]|nr:hypothetical protein I317_00906 [Kwoniella heveanensis CBS 569]